MDIVTALFIFALLFVVVYVGSKVIKLLESIDRKVREISKPRDDLKIQNYSPNDVLVTTKMYEEALTSMQKYRSSGPKEKLAPEFVVETHDEAHQVLDKLKELLEAYKIVMLEDLNELIGVVDTFEASKWGWDDLTTAHVIKTSLANTNADEAGWTVRLPKLKLLSDLQLKVAKKEPDKV